MSITARKDGTLTPSTRKVVDEVIRAQYDALVQRLRESERVTCLVRREAHVIAEGARQLAHENADLRRLCELQQRRIDELEAR